MIMTNQEIKQQPLIDLFNQYAVNQKDWKIEEHKNQNWNETSFVLHLLKF